MAGSSMTFSHSKLGSGVRKVTIDWVSDDATGAVSGTTTEYIRGELLAAVTNPSGTAAPSDNYDIAITDEEGADVLGNCFDDLADRDTANTERVDFILYDGAGSIGGRPAVHDKLTVAVTNAGNSKAGRIVLYWRP